MHYDIEPICERCGHTQNPEMCDTYCEECGGCGECGCCPCRRDSCDYCAEDPKIPTPTKEGV